MTKKTATDRLKQYLKIATKPRGLKKLSNRLSDNDKEIAAEFLSLLALIGTTESREIFHLQILKFFYIRNNHDPIYAWEALSISNRYNLALPEWAVHEVMSCAEQLVNIDTSNFETSIKRALKLDGKSISRIKKLEKKLDAYFEVGEYINKGYSETQALHSVSEELEISPSSLRNYLGELEKVFNTQDPLPDPFSKI